MPALSARTQTQIRTQPQPQPRALGKPNVSKPNHNTSAANFNFKCPVRSLVMSTSASASTASLGLGYQYCFPIKLIIGQQQLWPRRTQVDTRLAVARFPTPHPPLQSFLLNTSFVWPLSGSPREQPATSDWPLLCINCSNLMKLIEMLGRML